MEVHESLLTRSEVKIYLGTVDKVSKLQEGEVQDYIGNTLNPMEIIFSAGSLISEARAVPLDHSNEVNVGDSVLIFSMENIFSSTYFYHSIRYVSKTNGSIYMKYKNSQVILIPKSEDKTELLVTGGKNIINIDPDLDRINIEAKNEVNINSHSGYINISNDKTSLIDIMNNLFTLLKNLKITTAAGPGVLDITSLSDLQELKLKTSQLLLNLDSSFRYPNVPTNTYTKEFAFDLVGEAGIEALNDEDIKDSKTVQSLKSKFPNQQNRHAGDPEVINKTRTTPVDLVIVEDVEDYDPEEDIQLSENYYLSDLSTKALFPHKVQAQENLTREEIISNLKNIAVNILEPLREAYPNIRINSGFRTNTSSNSQHEKGEAVDIQIPSSPPKDYLKLTQFILDNIPYDQLIFEHGNSIWLHISLKRVGTNRHRELTMLNNQYESGIKLYYT